MPEYAEVFDKVKEALVDALGVEDDEVTEEATMVGDLGAESIDFWISFLSLRRLLGFQFLVRTCFQKTF